MKIAWLSANRFGYNLLREAIKLHDIECVITLDNTSNIKMYDGIRNDLWDKLGIPVFRTDNINEDLDLLNSIRPDIIIVAGWRQVIDKEILDKYTLIGFHPTLLPYGRGQAPIINTILSGLNKSGVTMFYIDEGIDSGDIIGQEEFDIGEDFTSDMVYVSVELAGIRLLKKYLNMLIIGIAPRIKQDDSKATYFKTPKSNSIEITDDVETIYRKIRAFSEPYDGAYIEKDGKKLIIWEAELVE